MALSNEDILNAIAEMSVMDVVALVSAMEEKFGVSAQAAVAVAAVAAAVASVLLDSVFHMGLSSPHCAVSPLFLNSLQHLPLRSW